MWSAPAALACARLGPIMIVFIPKAALYSMVKVEDIPEIVEEHLLKGRIVTRLLYQETVAEDTIKSLNHTPFYEKQRRIALRNCGVINPELIDEYIAMDGYAALGKALTEMTPAEVIQTVKDSGLRGRGGGGFPTGVQRSWRRPTRPTKKYVCCNADEAATWRFHGPLGPRGRSPRRAGGHGHRRLCHRRDPGIYFTSALNIPSPSRDCRSPSSRPMNTACWARIF